MAKAAKARKIIAAALSKGKADEMQPLAVVVVDAGGHVVASERHDGASPGRMKIAEAKAYGVVMLGLAGGPQMERAESQAYFTNAINGVFDGKMVPVPGGVLLRDKKENIIGAVGVSGDSSENDVAAALAGAEAAGLTAEA